MNLDKLEEIIISNSKELAAQTQQLIDVVGWVKEIKAKVSNINGSVRQTKLDIIDIRKDIERLDKDINTVAKEHKLGMERIAKEQEKNIERKYKKMTIILSMIAVLITAVSIIFHYLFPAH